MANEQPIRPIDRWHSIVPGGQVPTGTDAWSVEIPNIGVLHARLKDKPGDSGEGKDKKAYVMGTDLDGLEINSLTLLSKGYKTLSLMLDAINSPSLISVSIRSGGKSIFNGIFQASKEEKEILKPQSMWVKEHEQEGAKPLARDVMVMPGKDLTQIQIHFEGGEN